MRYYFKPFVFFVVLSMSFIWKGGLIAQNAQTLHYDKGSVFYAGYACIQQGAHYFYIDSTGERVFDTIYNGMLSDLGVHYETYQSRGYEEQDLLPNRALYIGAAGKVGVLSREGKMILAPIYDKVDMKFRQSWKVTKGGKQSIFTAKKGFLLPFKFTEVWNMDDRYFNVVDKDKWGVYDAKTDQLVVPCIYEDMDYCYGCSLKGDYVFAKKAGKWGIVDFHHKQLLPFEYEHQHVQMRSDEWVYSLLKNGQPVVINLQTGSEEPYNLGEWDRDQKEALQGGFYIDNKSDRWGMFDQSGKQIFPYEYDYIRYDADSMNGYYLPAPLVALRKNDLCGIGDTLGNIIIPTTSEDWIYHLGKFLVVTKDKKQLLYDWAGKKVLKNSYEQILSQSLDGSDKRDGLLLKLMDDNKYGFYNSQTGALLEPTYDGLNFNNQMSWSDSILAVSYIKGASYESNRYGLVDIRSGEQLLKPLYNALSTYENSTGNVLVKEDSLYGIYNIFKKDFICPVAFSLISDLPKAALMIACKGDQFGLLDKTTGSVVCPFEYEDIQLIDSLHYRLTKKPNLAKVRYFIFNAKTSSLVPLDFIDLDFSGVDGVMLGVKEDNKGQLYTQLYDPIHNKIIEGAYSKGGYPSYIGHFYKGVASITKNNKFGLVTPEGALQIKPHYDNLSSLKNGLALAVNMAGKNHFGEVLYKYGVVDSAGRQVLPIAYDLQSVYQLSDYLDLPNFILLHKIKPVSKEGEKEALRPRQKVITNVAKGWSVAEAERPEYEIPNGQLLEGLANTKGEVIVPPIYDEVNICENGRYFLVKKGEKLGILDHKGNILIPIIYKNLWLNKALLWYTRTVDFNFPILVSEDKGCRYLGADGKALPKMDIRVKEPLTRLPGNYDLY